MSRTLSWLLLGTVLVTTLIAIALHTLGARLVLDRDDPAWLRGPVDVRARLQQPLAVKLDQQAQAKVRLEQLEIPLDERLEVPLRMQLDVPIDTEIAVKQVIDLAL